MFELNITYTHSEPAGTISEAGILELRKYIRSQKLDSAEWKPLNPEFPRVFLPELPEDWQWVWVVERGEYAGTMPKRMAKFYHQQGIKCPPAFLSEIGNIARRHSADSVVYTFEVTAEFDWYAGDFGDAGSCYWTYNSGARIMLKENDAYAIRFYDASGKGIGRAWLFKADNDLLIIWNGYGFYDSSLTITRVFATKFGLTYRKIDLSNNGEIGGTLYINGGIGYAVGTSIEIDEYDFEWYDEHSYTCEGCGRNISEDSMYYGADEMDYCENCFYRYFETCTNCGEVEYSEHTTVVGYDYLCRDCAESKTTVCDECGETIYRSAAAFIKEQTLCENCCK